MKRKLSVIVLLTIVLAIVSPNFATADDVIKEGIPQIDATSYIVIEGSSGEILFGNNYQQQAAPASITKIMTAVLAIEKADLQQVITVGKLPADMLSGTTQVYLREGEKVKLIELLKAAIVYSANDAAYVIGDALGPGSESFVKMMNDKAKEIGMKNTTFSNAHGLTEDGHLTTAEDMAVLGRYAMSLDKYREITILRSIDWQGELNQTVLSNGNTFLNAMPEATGVKAGYTAAAQNTLVGSAKKDGRELIGVILGSSSKSACNDAMKIILNFGFENTKVQQIVQKDMAIATIQFSEKKEVRVVSKASYGITRLKDDATSITYETKLKNIELPITKGDIVGGLEVMVDGNMVHEVPLIALDTARKPINWLLLLTGMMTILYLAQMLVRIFRMLRKNRNGYRKLLSDEQSAGQEETECDDFERFVSSLEHPKNRAAVNRKPSGNRETRPQPTVSERPSNQHKKLGEERKSPRDLPRKY